MEAERENYYELLGLDFEKEPNLKKNKKRLEEKIEAWEKEANASTDETRRSQLERWLSMRGDMETVVAQDIKLCRAEAKKLKEQRKGELSALIDIMIEASGSNFEVNQAQIASINKKTGLSKEAIKEVYHEKGIVEQPQEDMNGTLREAFMSDTTEKGIRECFQKMRDAKLSGPEKSRYCWQKLIHEFDFYDLACVLDYDLKHPPENGEEKERSKKIDEALQKDRENRKYTDEEREKRREAIDEYNKKNRGNFSRGAGDFAGNLCAKALDIVFKDKSTFEKYNKTRKKESLRDLFEKIKGAPDVFKRDPILADACISKIEQVFHDHGLALSLYNLEAQIIKDPYLPLDASVYVTCGQCDAMAKFRTQKEAESGKCPTCGAALYVSCPKCGKRIPASGDACTCGFSFSQRKEFEGHVRALESALKSRRLDDAREFFYKADAIDSKDAQLKKLHRDLEKAEEEYKRPLEEIKESVSAKAYYKARDMVPRVQAALPEFAEEIGKLKKTIDNQIEWAERKLREAEKSNDAANIYREILNCVQDCSVAKEKLKGIKPKAPSRLRLAAGKACGITWEPSGEIGITYRVVRKENAAPAFPGDGTIVADKLTTCACKDEAVEPGRCFYYAVFAMRDTAFSEALRSEGMVYCPEARDVTIQADGNRCFLSWAMPKNCAGVQVLRSEGLGEEKKMSDLVAAERFEDHGLKDGTTYRYRLRCVYNSKGKQYFSAGVSESVTPDANPPEISGIESSVSEDGTVTLKWKTDAPEVQVWRIDGAMKVGKGKVIQTKDMDREIGGQPLCTEHGSSCQFSVAEGSSLNVALAAISKSGTKAWISDVISVSNTPPCKLDRKESRIDRGELILKIENPHQTLKNIYYSIDQKTNENESAPWKKIDDIKAMKKITVKDYKDDDGIYVEKIPNGMLYITVIGECHTSNGKVLFSEPSKMRIDNTPKIKITYTLVRKTSLFGFGKSQALLTVECPSDDTPEMKLVCSADGGALIRQDAPGNITLHTIPKNDANFKNWKYEYRISDEILGKLPKGPGETTTQLFVSEEDSDRFEISSHKPKI